VPESYDQWYAEASYSDQAGHPHSSGGLDAPFELGTVRRLGFQPRCSAVSDAMPLLEKAKKVRIVTVANEKADSKHSWLAKNLARHGIDVVLDKVDATAGGSARC
jgi:hypothetical protein